MDEKVEINHSDVPIRLFRSDFLEFFTHVHPIVVIILWTPIIVYAFIHGYLHKPAAAGPAYLLGTFVVGLLIWTFVEYLAT